VIREDESTHRPSRPRNPAAVPCVLTVAGSDSGGGAGIQADLKTITVLGGFGMSALTALTAQNTQGVTAVHPVPPEFVLKQIETVAVDLPIHAAKTGMLASPEIVEAVAEGIRRFHIAPLVIDPVFISKSGHSLLPAEARDSLVRSLFPLARLVTPNLHEASLLAGFELKTEEDWKEAARRLHGAGPAAVLIKGGHGSGAEARDLLFDGVRFQVFTSPRFETPNTHGTGCTYSAAIATFLARDLDLDQAVGEAKKFIAEAIRLSLPIGHGHGPTNPYAAACRDVERFRVLRALERAARDIQSNPALALLAPEVQSNLGYALPLAETPEEVAAFPGRLVRLPEGLRPAGAPAFGVSRHIAGVILAAMRHHPELRSAMNIRFSESLLEKAVAHRLHVAGFDRAREPADVKSREGSTLEWGTLEAIRGSPVKPDLIHDRGEIGKEPMIRVLGTDPVDVLRKIALLL
jgi:hydroxymethylpyrimidine kinase / phosphomethylpyrimidine kinase / thiamine-phosphate diphosphorylase